MDLQPHALSSISDIPGPEWAQMFFIYLGHLFVVTWHGIVRTLGIYETIKLDNYCIYFFLLSSVIFEYIRPFLQNL